MEDVFSLENTRIGGVEFEVTVIFDVPDGKVSLIYMRMTDGERKAATIETWKKVSENLQQVYGKGNSTTTSHGPNEFAELCRAKAAAPPSSDKNWFRFIWRNETKIIRRSGALIIRGSQYALCPNAPEYVRQFIKSNPLPFAGKQETLIQLFFAAPGFDYEAATR